jgi:hypothetical protein
LIEKPPDKKENVDPAMGAGSVSQPKILEVHYEVFHCKRIFPLTYQGARAMVVKAANWSISIFAPTTYDSMRPCMHLGPGLR